MLPRESHPHAHARAVRQLAVQDGVRAGEVDVLEHAVRYTGVGDWRGDAAQAVPVDDDGLSRLDLADELGAHMVERAALGRDDPSAGRVPAQGQRPDAVRVADAKQRVLGRDDQRVRPFQRAHHVRGLLFPRVAGRPREEVG